MPNWSNYRHLPLMVILVVAACIVITVQVASHMDKNARQELINYARIAAMAINPQRLKQLSGKPDDIELTDYQRIKEQLYTIRTGSNTCKFLYILAFNPQDNTVYFFVDSQKPDSPDYAPPGLIYEEVSDEFRAAVKAGVETFVGPVTDRWGTIMTSLIPLHHPDTGEVLAMLGMDVEADDWYTYVAGLSIPHVGLTVVISVLLIVIILLKYRTQELRQSMSIDALTNMLNRKTVLNIARQEFNRARHNEGDFAILLIDIDDFKHINDKYGHQNGDNVLREVATCMKENLRKTDYAGRVGGEEFLILAPNTTNEDAFQIADKLRTMVSTLTFSSACGDCPDKVTISVGVCHLIARLENFSEMFRCADKALYDSKNAGKNRVTLHSTTDY